MGATISGIFGSLPLLSLLFLNSDHISISLAIQSAIAGFLTTCFFFFYFKSLDVEQPSIVVTLQNLVPATLPFLAFFLLHEKLGHLEIVGFIFVLTGSVLLAATDIKKFKFSAALLPTFIGVILVDILSLISKHVYDQTAFYPAYMAYCGGVGIGGIYFFLVMFFNKTAHKFKTLKGSLVKIIPILFLAEALNLAAEFTINLAISRGSVSVVRVIEGLQPLFVLVIALVFYPLAPKYFREAKAGNLTRKFVLMLVAVVGLVLINVAVR